MIQRLLAIDPGVTTGIAAGLWNTVDHSFSLSGGFQLPWEKRFAVRWLVEEADIIVIESFRLYRHKATDQVNSDFPSSQVIGMTELAAYMVDKLDKVVKQPASCIQNVQILEADSKKLEGLQHAQDAYRHLRYYVISRQDTKAVSAASYRQSRNS